MKKPSWTGCVEEFGRTNGELIMSSVRSMDFDRLDAESAFLDEDPADFYPPRELSFYEAFKRYCALNK